jgi:hypothetical protein
MVVVAWMGVVVTSLASPPVYRAEAVQFGSRRGSSSHAAAVLQGA